MMIWAFDPGAKGIGWAKWSGFGYPSTSRVGRDELYDLLNRSIQSTGTKPDVVVIEDWRLRRAAHGKTMATSEVLGAIEFAAFCLGADVVRQPPETYKLGAMYEGFQLPNGHMPDEQSAKMHLIYYAVTHGLMRQNNPVLG